MSEAEFQFTPETTMTYWSRFPHSRDQVVNAV